jgi:transient receptor potential cation channel subfamily M protein 2
VSSNELTDSQYIATHFGENETKMLDNHHTHFLLLDDGHLNHYLNDDPRSKFVKTTCDRTGCHAVTIIVEGGVNTLGVIQNDLHAQRPVVIVHGSGRLATVLGNLLEIAGKTGTIG